MRQKLKVVIDARMYGLEHAGIGRYVMNLLKAIKKEKLKSQFNFVLLINSKKEKEIKEELGSEFIYWPVKSSHYSLGEQLEIPLILKQIKPDLVHFPHFNVSLLWPGNFVVTIHDLIKHYFRGRETTTKRSSFYWLKYFGYRLLVNFVLKRAKLIFTPSNYWRKKLMTDFAVDKEKIVVTYEGIDSSFLQLTKHQRRVIKEKFNFKQPFLIYTGSVYPHKNVNRLLLALREINGVNLLIACSRNIFTQRLAKLVKQLNLKSRVFFLGFVSDQDLVFLYRRAVALVQPSLMEGFGLTGLEAMAAGCPVLAAKKSCLPEIYGSAALYFDPLDLKDIAKKIEIILTDEKLREGLIKRGKRQIKRYSWQKTAQKTIRGYLRVLGQKDTNG